MRYCRHGPYLTLMVIITFYEHKHEYYSPGRNVTSLTLTASLAQTPSNATFRSSLSYGFGAVDAVGAVKVVCCDAPHSKVKHTFLVRATRSNIKNRNMRTLDIENRTFRQSHNKTHRGKRGSSLRTKKRERYCSKGNEGE